MARMNVAPMLKMLGGGSAAGATSAGSGFSLAPKAGVAPGTYRSASGMGNPQPQAFAPLSRIVKSAMGGFGRRRY